MVKTGRRMQSNESCCLSACNRINKFWINKLGITLSTDLECVRRFHNNYSSCISEQLEYLLRSFDD